jgi:hypothetical protein
MSKDLVRMIDNSPFERVATYNDVLFRIHSDGKSQSSCMVFLRNTLVHEASIKLKTITKCLIEAELVALSHYIFVMDLGVMMDEDLVTNVHIVCQ